MRDGPADDGPVDAGPAHEGGPARGGLAASVSVTLPPALLALFPGAPMVLTLQADDIGAVLDGLDARWPGMRDRLSDSRPAIRRHMQLFVDGRHATLETPLQPRSDVVFMTAMSGG